MAFVYDLIFTIFALISLPKFAVRLKQAADGKALVRERFGCFTENMKRRLAQGPVLWLHAVSVGEVQAVRSWIRLFIQTRPDWMVALSVTTPTGFSVARALDSERVVSFYAPFDLSWVVRRVLQSVRPKLILLVETELWPNLIGQASKAGIPIGMVNGRISPRSFPRYRLIRPLMASLLKKLSFCFVQTRRDQQYFAALGMSDSQILCVGNMKFDSFQTSQNGKKEQKGIFESLITSGAPIWVAGSTHWNEEEKLLRVFSRLRSDFPNLKLILVPRHLEQISKVAQAVKRSGFWVQLFSNQRFGREDDVLLVDRIGVLASLYSLSDLVFVGGSFVRHGGQNPIEAALWKKPLLHGPHVFNFEEIYRDLDREGGAFQVFSEEELYQESKRLLSDPKNRIQAGEKAFSVVQSMQGASRRVLEHILGWMECHLAPASMTEVV